MLPWFRALLRQPYDSPASFLILLFLAWKLLLLAVAFATPGPGYDTSTQLLLLKGYGIDGLPNPNASAVAEHYSGVERLVERLTRWDAIYFTSVGSRGRVYEQEWAFGWGWTELLAYLHRKCPISSHGPLNVAIIGILISNACHLLSALVLERLVRSLDAPAIQGRVAFVAAALHVFSPAGLFLSAPYAESLFSLLSFLGHLCYAYSRCMPTEARSHKHDAWLLASGAWFGLATTVRGNGVLFGLIFAYDALVSLMVFVREYPKVTDYWLYASTAVNILISFLFRPDFITQAPSDWPLWYWVAFGVLSLDAGLFSLRYLLPEIPSSLIQDTSSFFCNMISIIVAGLCVAVGLVFPQYLAYTEYCLGTTTPVRHEWCSKTIPSIFSWVQSHYWNVGMFRYWTLSNLPLFILATPMLTLLLISSYRYMPKRISDIFTAFKANSVANENRSRSSDRNWRSAAILQRFALTQLAVAILALTSFHVQIITRLSSGYPLWSIFVASAMSDGRKSWTNMVVRWSVMYVCVQGVLFADFLPPA